MQAPRLHAPGEGAKAQSPPTPSPGELHFIWGESVGKSALHPWDRAGDSGFRSRSALRSGVPTSLGRPWTMEVCVGGVTPV